MITFIPKRPDVLISPMHKPSAMALLAYDMAFREYKNRMQELFIDKNKPYWESHMDAKTTALIVLSVNLSFACEGVLYEV